MKIFAFILAVIVLGLSCIPCQDALAIQGSNTSVESAKCSQEEQGVPHEDECSPFCTCSCCAGVSFNIQQITVVVLNAKNIADNPSYISAAMMDVALPIWQPPQLTA